MAAPPFSMKTYAVSIFYSFDTSNWDYSSEYCYISAFIEILESNPISVEKKKSFLRAIIMQIKSPNTMLGYDHKYVGSK